MIKRIKSQPISQKGATTTEYALLLALLALALIPAVTMLVGDDYYIVPEEQVDARRGRGDGRNPSDGGGDGTITNSREDRGLKGLKGAFTKAALAAGGSASTLNGGDEKCNNGEGCDDDDEDMRGRP